MKRLIGIRVSNQGIEIFGFEESKELSGDRSSTAKTKSVSLTK